MLDSAGGKPQRRRVPGATLPLSLDYVPRDLKNKPLVEAIVELRWELKPQQPGGPPVDPYYKLLIGALYQKVSGDYPEHEQLPTASVPDAFVAQMVQHRFRSAPNAWPLLQIGPGILTLNHTENYLWPDFRRRAIDIVGKLFEAHPRPTELKIENLVLRYIDAIEMDYRAESIFTFLSDKLKISIQLPEPLFAGGSISSRPMVLNFQSSFFSSNPAAFVTLRLATGHKDQNLALLMETWVDSKMEGIPSPMPAAFADWLDSAHKITHDWFFKLIEGELERKFSE